ncbi:MAG: RecX family transcriptional regulator [Bacteroidetes bacterium]|nr:RecX family transcriptional regulator [Bacteroidota bacterium]
MIFRKLQPEVAWKKIQKYCAWQERCHKEVREKLYGFGLATPDVEELITKLIQSGFLNEERFSRSYAGGKFRTKKWGRIRIVRELEMRDISEYCIRKAMEEIDESDYQKTLHNLLNKKSREYNDDDEFSRNGKLARFAISKGYEPNLVWELIKNGLENQP